MVSGEVGGGCAEGPSRAGVESGGLSEDVVGSLVMMMMMMW